MSRSERTPPGHQATGAHRAVPHVHRPEARDTPQGRRPAPYEPYLDGLFTYCLSVLCEHDAALGALGDTLAVAERSHGRLRDQALRRPWLYAIARWACLNRFADADPAAGRSRTAGARTPHPRTAGPRAPGPRAAGPPGTAARPAGPPNPGPRTARRDAERRRRELAALCWPEAAGTIPEQREAIELAVRHQLTETEIAAVIGAPVETARSLLSRAACEVERTRTALSVVDLGGCPAVARLAGDARELLGTALRRELVRHVDECPACRLTAERAVATGPWPGTATPSVLAVVEAPRQAVSAATAHSLSALRTGARDDRVRLTLPRFDRRGFPLDDKDRAARRAQLRHRAVTGTVVAAVVAAPALALWAAYHHAPPGGGAQGGGLVSATAADGSGSYAYGGKRRPGGRPRGGRGPVTADGSGHRPTTARSADDPGRARAGAVPSSATGAPSGGPSSAVPGRIIASVHPQGADTVITITDVGDTSVRWTAATAASWLGLSAASGELRPGRSDVLTVTVDHTAEPAGHWHAQVALDPFGPVVVEGRGTTPTPPPPETTPSATPSGPRP